MEKMIIDRDVPIPMEDGLSLRADIYRPKDGKPAPVIMTMGPYGKGLPWRVGYKPQWEALIKEHPDLLAESSKEFMVWEVVDPEIWTSWGYVCIRIDSRGAGCSPGYLDTFSPRETKDLYNAIEWAGVQPWSTGKVGLSGISYFAINQWYVASLQPPHLTAMIPWEGAADFYRDITRHGGILSNAFLDLWYGRQVISVQHGNPTALHDPWRDDLVSGSRTMVLSPEQLKANRSDPVQAGLSRPLDSEFYRSRSADWSKVTVPFLSCASWGGYGLHSRGNFEAFTQAASKQKWLECHPGKHEEWFYVNYGLDIQKRFLDHFLKGEQNGWDKEAPVSLVIRRPFSTDFEALRQEQSWPLERTEWTSVSLAAAGRKLSWSRASSDTTEQVQFAALDEPVTFMSEPLEQELEITGPLVAKIFASSSTIDMDLFLTFQAFSPDGKEVEFQGSLDPHTPLAQGWLRASHRKLDPVKSTPYRPYHTHDEIQTLEPGKVYELDVEIWPTHIILPAGFRIALQISGKDFKRPTEQDMGAAWVASGSGPFLHTHPEDRPASIFGGKTTIYTGGDTPSSLLLPIIPRQ